MAVVWGVWLHDTFYFFTSKESRKARNIATKPSCVVCPEHTDEAVIVEGVAEEVTDPTVRRQFQDAYAAKYHEEVDTDKFSIYALRPDVAFGAISDPVAWPGSATRWRFRDT
jgi:general stress protein 26